MKISAKWCFFLCIWHCFSSFSHPSYSTWNLTHFIFFLVYLPTNVSAHSMTFLILLCALSAMLLKLISFACYFFRKSAKCVIRHSQHGHAHAHFHCKYWATTSAYNFGLFFWQPPSWIIRLKSFFSHNVRIKSSFVKCPKATMWR